MKNINTILFDLDGTLLPMDVEAFTNAYLHEVGKYFMDEVNPKELVKYIWIATGEMVKNTGAKTNEEVFWESFHSLSENKLLGIDKKFEEFYDNKFPELKSVAAKDKNMIDAVHSLKSMGYNILVATNPLFPQKAIHERIRWAGFDTNDFIYISSFEKNHYCKPQVKYYEEILSEIGKKPEECMMVGNDMDEDLIAGTIGLKTWLVTNCLIESRGESLNPDFKGSSEEFLNFVKNMESII